jgi:hypothetical protein
MKWVNSTPMLTGYGTGAFVAELAYRGIAAHVALQAGSEMEEVPSWKRRTFNLAHYRARREKERQAEARNQVRRLHKTHGYTVSRKLRIRSEHIFAEAKNEHGLGRARHRGLEKVDRHSVLVAAVQNLKRLSGWLWRKAQSGAGDLRFGRAFLRVMRSLTALRDGSRPHIRRRGSLTIVGARVRVECDRIALKPHCSTAF